MPDDDVKLPAQVQKQEDEANRLWEEQHGKTDDKKGEVPPEPAPEPEPSPEPEPEPEPIEEGDLEPEPEPAPEPDPEPEPVDIQHKFDVLQGKYDAEVPRLSEENKKLRAHSTELGQIIGTLQAEVEKLKAQQGKEQPEPKVDASQTIRQFLDDEEMEELQGSVDPKLLGKVIDGIIASRMQPLEQSLGSVQTSQHRTAEEVFWEKVDAIPNMEKVNTSPEFNDWLAQKAPYTHLTRRQILQTAEQNLDSATVVEMFGDFAKTQPGPVQDPPAPSGGKRKPRISPAKGAGSGATPASPQGKIWTPKEINAFYQDVQKGKYRGKDKERKQKEHDIWIAQREGRINRA